MFANPQIPVQYPQYPPENQELYDRNKQGIVRFTEGIMDINQGQKHSLHNEMYFLLHEFYQNLKLPEIHNKEKYNYILEYIHQVTVMLIYALMFAVVISSGRNYLNKIIKKNENKNENND